MPASSESGCQECGRHCVNQSVPDIYEGERKRDSENSREQRWGDSDSRGQRGDHSSDSGGRSEVTMLRIAEKQTW